MGERIVLGMRMREVPVGVGRACCGWKSPGARGTDFVIRGGSGARISSRQRELERQTYIWLSDIGGSGREFTLNIEYRTSVSFLFFPDEWNVAQLDFSPRSTFISNTVSGCEGYHPIAPPLRSPTTVQLLPRQLP